VVYLGFRCASYYRGKCFSFISGTEYVEDVLVLVKNWLEERGRFLRILVDKLSSPLVVMSQGSRSIESLKSLIYRNNKYLLPSTRFFLVLEY